MSRSVATSATARMLRALRLRCPACGARGVLAAWTSLARTCPRCGLRPDRGEPDHFLGGYVINLGVAELIAAVLWLLMLWRSWPSPNWDLMQWAAAVLVVLAPIALYPFTRLLFLAIDLSAQPSRPGDYGEGDRSGS